MDHGVLSSSVSWDGKTIPRLENINEQAYNHEVKEAAEESIVRNNFSGCRVSDPYMLIVSLNGSVNFDWALQSIGLLSVQFSGFRRNRGKTLDYLS